MTDSQILEWFSLLGQSYADRMCVARNLLLHAAEDNMSAEDRMICERVLRGDLKQQAQGLPDSDRVLHVASAPHPIRSSYERRKVKHAAASRR